MTKETKQAFGADGMRQVGVTDDTTYKLTMRELNRAAAEETVFPLTGSEIRALRERAKLSQAVFARYLHLTVDHVSKLERGAKQPTGPALALLSVIRRKGIEAIVIAHPPQPIEISSNSASQDGRCPEAPFEKTESKQYVALRFG